MFVNEFADTSFVIRDGSEVIAYLFGCLSQTENIGYVHLAGVKERHQKKGLGRTLYDYFIRCLKLKGYSGLKAITTPGNVRSIAGQGLFFG